MDYTYDATAVATTTDASMSAGLAAFFVAYSVVILVISVFMIVCLWRIFTKAGKPGWASIVPFYNIVVLLNIVGRPSWWLVLYFVPFVNIVIGIIVMIDLAKAFSKDTIFAIILILLPIVGLPMLAFGKDEYKGPVAKASA